MTTTPDFNLVMPYYGDVALLKLAVRSVQAQTHRDWHLTVLDDCYPDPEPARWFGELDDPRITYVRHPRNLGANANYRLAHEHLRGTHVMFMGADDLMLPGYLALVTELLGRHPDAALVQVGVRAIGPDGRRSRSANDVVKRWLTPRVPAGREVVLAGDRLVSSLMHGNWLYFPSLMWDVRRVREAGLRPGLDIVHDLALLVDVLVAGGELVVSSEVAFEYRRHEGSMSSASWRRRFDEERALYRTVREELPDSAWPHTRRAARSHVAARLLAALQAARLVRERRVRDAVQVGKDYVVEAGARRRR